MDTLNAGRSYIPDVKTEDVAALRAGGKLVATTDYAVLRAADAVSICVPTPLRKTRDPDMSYVINARGSVASLGRRSRETCRASISSTVCSLTQLASAWAVR